MMHVIPSTIAKFLGLWVSLVLGLIVGALVIGGSGDGSEIDGPFTFTQAIVLVNGLHAVILTTLALQSRLAGLRLALLIGGASFGIQSFMLQIETLFLIDFVGIPLRSLMQGVAANLCASVFAGITCAVLWRTPQTGSKITVTHLPIRIAMISALYAALYFLAGYFIAWRSDTLRAYYGDGVEIDVLALMVFQVFRGILWGLLALVIAHCLTNSISKRALIVGAAFSILASSQLFYPNTYMPWDVRWVHLIELGVSNFVFGVCAVTILYWHPRTTWPSKRPIA